MLQFDFRKMILTGAMMEGTQANMAFPSSTIQWTSLQLNWEENQCKKASNCIIYSRSRMADCLSLAILNGKCLVQMHDKINQFTANIGKSGVRLKIRHWDEMAIVELQLESSWVSKIRSLLFVITSQVPRSIL